MTTLSPVRADQGLKRRFRLGQREAMGDQPIEGHRPLSDEVGGALQVVEGASDGRRGSEISLRRASDARKVVRSPSGTPTSTTRPAGLDHLECGVE